MDNELRNQTINMLLYYMFYMSSSNSKPPLPQSDIDSFKRDDKKEKRDNTCATLEWVEANNDFDFSSIVTYENVQLNNNAIFRYLDSVKKQLEESGVYEIYHLEQQ